MTLEEVRNRFVRRTQEAREARRVQPVHAELAAETYENDAKTCEASPSLVEQFGKQASEAIEILETLEDWA